MAVMYSWYVQFYQNTIHSHHCYSSLEQAIHSLEMHMAAHDCTHIHTHTQACATYSHHLFGLVNCDGHSTCTTPLTCHQWDKRQGNWLLLHGPFVVVAFVVLGLWTLIAVTSPPLRVHNHFPTQSEFMYSSLQCIKERQAGREGGREEGREEKGLIGSGMRSRITFENMLCEPVP